MTNADTNRSTGIILIVLGAALVAMRLTGFTFAGLLWPFWVLIPGMLALYMGFRGERANLGWVVPGALIGGTGAILFTLNLTNQWESWAYAWALYPTFVGSALYAVGRHNGEDNLVTGGKASIRSGLFMFLGFGLFFELMIFGGLSFLDGPLLPLALIVAGIVLFFGRDYIKVNLFGGEKPKRKPKLGEGDPVTGINPDLRRRMDAALTEDEATTA